MQPSSAAELIHPAPPLLPLSSRERKGSRTTFITLMLLAIAMAAGVRNFAPPQLRLAFAALDLSNLRGATSLVAALAVAIVLHEAGHLFAAILLNFDILGIALGPFRATRSYGAWRIRFSAKSLFSGSISAIPRKVYAWRTRMLLVVAAGPIATLLTGTAAGVTLCLQVNSSWTSTFLGALTELSLFIFVLGLVPNAREARIRNDARLLLVLCRNGLEARAIFLYHLITQLEIAGIRPREYPKTLMAEVAEIQGQPELMLFSAHSVFVWALDRGHLETAHAWDIRCLELSERCEPRSRNLALAHSACFDMLFGGGQMDARHKFTELDWQTLSPSWLMHRAQAAYYLANGKVAECLAEIARARYSLPAGLPFCAFELMLLARLHEKALALKPPELWRRVHQAAA